MNQTQIKLIEAAEREFAEHGFHGASIRNITRRAKANVAAVNYHFGSKEKLFIEMIRLRVQPINEQRLKLLKTALELNEGQPLSVREIVSFLMRPMIEAYFTPESKKGNPYFLRAVGRGMSEDAEFMSKLRQDIFAEVIANFRGELSRALPKAPPELVQQAFSFLGFTLSGLLQQKRSREAPSSLNVEAVVAYITGGIEALVAETLNDSAKT